MNVVKSLISRIENRRAETKNPCKSYSSEAAAEKAAEHAVSEGMNYYRTAEPARYIVAYNEAWGRWVVGIDMTEYMRRKDFGGGYIGFFKGYYCY